MNNRCTFIEENTVLVRSFLEEQNFARTDLTKLMNEAGCLATVHADGTVEPDDWQFSRTKVLDDKTVAFTGPAFGGETLARIFEEQASVTDSSGTEKELINKKIVCVFKVLDLLVEKIENAQNLTLPSAEGILISDGQNGSVKVLVLPGSLFERCAENSKEYGAFQGIFVHRGLTGLEAALFTRATIAYRAVTGKYAFTKEKLEEKQADITDSNFVPAEYEANGIQAELAQSINAGLCVKAKKRIIPGERRFVNEKEENERLSILENAKKLNSALIENFFNEQKTQNGAQTFQPQKDFDAARASFIKKQAKQIKIRRFYSRNSKRIWGSVVAVIVALSVASNFNRENRKLATSMGLTSVQTVQTLFTGIHTADVTIIQEIAKGKDSKNLIQTVSGFYVTNKQRVAMDEKDGTLSPAQWLFFKGTTGYWQYGLTDFKIDGKEYSPVFDYPRRKDKNAPLAQEDGKTLKKGDEAVHTVNYNLVYNEGETTVTVYKTTENVTLRWNGKRWIVRSIKGTGKTTSGSYSVKKYKADYVESLETAGGSVRKAAELLRKKYSFAPTELDLKAAVPYMIKKYNNSAAKEFESELSE